MEAKRDAKREAKRESSSYALKSKFDIYYSRVSLLEKLQIDSNITVEKVSLITNGKDIGLNMCLMMKLKEDDINSVESLRSRLISILKDKDSFYGALLNMLNQLKTIEKSDSSTPQQPTTSEKSNRAPSHQKEMTATPEEKLIALFEQKVTKTSTSKDRINQIEQSGKSSNKQTKKVYIKDPEYGPPNQTTWTLEEDLALIKFSKTKKPGMNQPWHKAILESNIPEFGSRPKGALGSRYRVFLQYLTDEEISIMKKYYETKGNGYVHFRQFPNIVNGKRRWEYHIFEINTNPIPKCKIPRRLDKKWLEEFAKNQCYSDCFDNNSKEIYPFHKKVKRNEGSQINKVNIKDDTENDQKVLDTQASKSKVNTKISPIFMITTKIFPKITFTKYPNFMKFKSLDDIWNDDIKVTKIFEAKAQYIKNTNWEIYDKITIYSDFEKKIRTSTVENIESIENVQYKKLKHTQGLELLSKHLNIPYKKMETLHFQVSGNYDTLQKYLHNYDENLLWSSEEDIALRAALNHPALFKSLIAEKGEENLKERTQFLADMSNSHTKKQDIRK